MSSYYLMLLSNVLLSYIILIGFQSFFLVKLLKSSFRITTSLVMSLNSEPSFFLSLFCFFFPFFKKKIFFGSVLNFYVFEVTTCFEV